MAKQVHIRVDDDMYEDLLDQLILADVGYETSQYLVDQLEAKVKRDKITTGRQALETMKQTIVELLSADREMDYSKKPTVILIIGVNGVGKTTTIGKLATQLVKQGKNVLLVAGDTFRAAASEQLSVWADRANVRIIKQGEGSDPSAVLFDAITSAKAKNTDVLIVDTAGRLHVKANLMEELKKMARGTAREYPNANFYKLIVLDATTGQNALSQVEVFDEAVELDGIVLTKLDGTAKGGFVISLIDEYQIPVAFVGVGEKIDDLESFNATEFVDALF